MDATRRATDAPNPAYERAAQAAEQELGQLMPRIPVLVVRVTALHRQAFEVFVDNRKIATALLGADLPTDPGKHRLELRRPGLTPVVRSISLSEGAREDVAMPLEGESSVTGHRSPATSAAVPVDSPTTGERADTVWKILGWVALGAGATGTVLGSVTGIRALNGKSRLDKVCRPGCPPAYADDIDSFRLNRSLSYLGFATGVVGIAGGGYLLLRGTPGRPQVVMSVTPSSTALEVIF
jgi:hypothetical protein